MFLMFLRILLLSVGVCSLGVPGKIKQYECGEHGRFEYCVDGVPRCVVGCHCHPGYYFDTDTKICEPNTKLVQDYRRHFVPEPTRVQIPITPVYEIEVTPTLSTKTPLDNQVDQALAKDTDDIGDWLYNQFFKTIENQVLSANNNTDNSNANNQTRRFGTSSSQKKSKRKKMMNKKIKFSKISKKDDLRRKLLRITEDDSLFDSDSRSRSGFTEDSKSSSNSDSSGTSLETEDDCKDNGKEKDKKNNDHPNDKEHGHRKILVVKKKPKPPLPSFIFLPNLETPFFPPIGLPPPPPMPMYPMVPVPPMPLPPFPFTMMIPTESDDKTKASKKTTHSHKHTTTHKPKETTHAPEHSTEAATSETPLEKVTETDQPTTELSDKPSLRSRILKRKKFLRQFREKHPGSFIPFDHRKAMKHMPPINPLMPSANDYMDIADMMEDMAPRERPPPPGPPPVDFKYLSQLIHKMNPNISNVDVKHKAAVPQRRFETPYYPHDPHIPVEPFLPATNEPPPSTQPSEAEESYYANLGQQIASLIRKLDNATPQPNPKSTLTHESKVNGDNNFASRSYWERSVRSLFSHYPPNSNDINFLRNEENLLSLENKVKVVATTQRSWNLNDLENVIFLVDRIKSRVHNMKMKKLQRGQKENLAIQTNVQEIETPKKLNNSEVENLNINLLPRQSDMLLNDKKEKPPIAERRNIPEAHSIAMTNETKNKTVNPLEELINKQSIHYNLRGILMQNFKNIFQKTDNQKHNSTNINHKSKTNPVFEGKSLRKLIRMDQHQRELQNMPLRPKVKSRAKSRKHEGDSERLMSNVKVLPKPSADIQQLNPMLSNYKNTQLHGSHHNKYIFENDALAFQLAPAPTQQERAYYQVPHHHNYFD